MLNTIRTILTIYELSGAFCVPIIQIVWETIKDIQTGKKTSSSSSAHTTESGNNNCFDFYRITYQHLT